MAVMTVGSLFSGIGGFDLGFERAGFEISWQCEIDPWARRVLHKHWPDVPCYEDIRQIGVNNLAPVDVLIGGFPCQDISIAGKGVGIGGERSGLWKENARLIRELRPRYAVMENVAALLHRGLDVVLGDLAACGYDAEWQVLSASAFGAPHRRDRLFVLAYPVSVNPSELHVSSKFGTSWRKTRLGQFNGVDGTEAWLKALRSLCRVDDGLPGELDRLRGLGNAIVPQVAQYVAECVLADARRGTVAA